MASKQTAGPKPVEMFIVVATSDLKDIQEGCLTSVDILGSGLTQQDAVDEANGTLDGDIEDADMTLVRVLIQNAFGLRVESKLVL